MLSEEMREGDICWATQPGWPDWNSGKCVPSGVRFIPRNFFLGQITNLMGAGSHVIQLNSFITAVWVCINWPLLQIVCWQCPGSNVKKIHILIDSALLQRPYSVHFLFIYICMHILKREGRFANGMSTGLHSVCITATHPLWRNMCTAFVFHLSSSIFVIQNMLDIIVFQFLLRILSSFEKVTFQLIILYYDILYTNSAARSWWINFFLPFTALDRVGIPQWTGPTAVVLAQATSGISTPLQVVGTVQFYGRRTGKWYFMPDVFEKYIK